jgi:hypothetical protein
LKQRFDRKETRYSRGRDRMVIWIYNYLCDQRLSPLTLRIWIPPRRGALDTTLRDKVCQWLAAGRWFSLGSPVFSTKTTDRHDIGELLLNVALSTITLTITHSKQICVSAKYSTYWLSITSSSCLIGWYYYTP